MDPGSLELTVTWDGRQIVAATIASTRPALARALAGMPAERVCAIIPRAFSLCRNAQGAAVRLCMDAARARRPVTAYANDLTLPVAIEAIVEHLYHLLMIWPRQLPEPDRRDPVKEFGFWRKRLLAACDVATAAALGVELSTWLAELAAPSFDDRRAPAAVALLPQLSAAEWLRLSDGKAFSASPTFAGEAAETGALARHAGDAGVAALLAKGERITARMAARLLELRWLAQGLVDPSRLATLVDAAAITAGCGLARVETARGTLLHRVELAGERVMCYQIVAPTDWNFHPLGALARELTGRPAATAEDALTAAAWLTTSLDPCVPCASRIVDA